MFLEVIQGQRNCVWLKLLLSLLVIIVEDFLNLLLQNSIQSFPIAVAKDVAFLDRDIVHVCIRPSCQVKLLDSKK